MPVKTRLPPEIFGDALMVLEFLYAFGELFDLQDEFPEGVTLGKLSFMWQNASFLWCPSNKHFRCTMIPLLQNCLCSFNIAVLIHAHLSVFAMFIKINFNIKAVCCKCLLVLSWYVTAINFALSVLPDSITIGIFVVNYRKVTFFYHT